jgi:hypothetical protein
MGYPACGLHEQQEIHDPLISGSSHQDKPHSHNCKALTRIPQDRWAEVAQRHASGESLRQLSKEYGVSHEAVRQILKKKG